MLCGAGELSEIATLAAYGLDVTLVAVLDVETNQARVAGLPVIRSLDEVEPGDILVITDERNPQETYDRLAAKVAPERVLAPAVPAHFAFAPT